MLLLRSLLAEADLRVMKVLLLFLFLRSLGEEVALLLSDGMVRLLVSWVPVAV